MATWRKGTGAVTSNGIPIANVTVYVYEKGTTNYCTIYSDEGVTPIDQASSPILSDAAGRYAFYLDIETYAQFRIFLDPSSAAEGYNFDLVNADLDGISLPSVGQTGSVGPRGLFGGDSFGYVFSTETGEADPGSGKLRYNNADPSLATEIYIDDEDENAVDIQAWLRTLDDSTSTVKGRLKVFKESDESKFATYSITAIVEESGYFKLSVTAVASNSTFSDADEIVVTFAFTGDKGDQGDTGDAAVGQIFYLDDEADAGAIDSYKRWRRAIPTGAEATLQATAKSGDADALIGVWISSANIPGIVTLLAGEWTFYIYAHMDSATGVSKIRAKVYKRTTGGAETEILSQLSNEINDLATALQEFIATVATDTSLNLTDRLVLKLYFTTTAPANKTVTVTFDGATHESHVHSTIFTGPIGEKGDQGDQGEFGGDSFEYVFSDETGDADPGSGKLRYNNADPSLATELYIDDEEANAVDIQAWLRTLDDSTNSDKGHLKVFKKSDSSKFATFNLTALSEETGYFKLTVTCVASNSTFSDADEIVITFGATGDVGDVSAVANITDHAIVRGDGGAKGVQESVPTIDDAGNIGMQDHDVLNSGNLTEIETSNRTIYVDADAVDDTGDGSVGDPYQLYATALADVKPVIADGVTITIHLDAATATYTPTSTGRVCIGTGKLLIEGTLSQEETATADSGTATTLTDTGAFTGDTYAGYLVHIISGTGSGQYRLIVSHTDDILTVQGRFSTSPANDSVYEILSWGALVTGANQWKFVQGTIEVKDIGSENMASSFISPGGYCDFTIERCSCKATGTAVFFQPYGPCQAHVDTCVTNGNAQGSRAFQLDVAGTVCWIDRSWGYGYTSGLPGIYLSGPGCSLTMASSRIDGSAGSVQVVLITNAAYMTAFCSSVNGANDVSTIIGDAGNTYGLYANVDGTGQAIGASYVTYVGAFSVANYGADAATFGQANA